MPDVDFTDRELDVMAILWEGGPSTVAEVRETLNARLPEPLAYTTVLTILRILEEKGYVRHTEEGRAHRYHPLVAREEAGRSALEDLIGRIFRGSPEMLITQLVSDRSLTEAEIRRMREILDRRLTEEEECR
ncbi:MAG: BlaI/MecI/CopY family transcriptional regulator [Gemmatimonadetes bacterium]|nr:BlaI/MecI/CopY family transcriptional regulator [Gemmatimonadota bacterium]